MLTQGRLHFADEETEVKKNGVYSIPFTKLKVLPDFNDRTDYGTTEEMQELAESLYSVGPKQPLKGYKNGDHYVIIVGHRRMKAAEMIKEKYGKTIIFPVIMYPPGTKKRDLILDTLLTNNGKDLTPLEKASAVNGLITEQVPEKDICSALGGVSSVYVKNLVKLWGIPEEAKKLIRDKVVSATLIMGFLKTKNANIEEFIQQIKKAASGADQEPGKGKGRKKKKAKVTAKNLKPGGTGKNALKAFRAFRALDPSEFEIKDKAEFFEFCCNLADNQLSVEQIRIFFTGK